MTCPLLSVMNLLHADTEGFRVNVATTTFTSGTNDNLPRTILPVDLWDIQTAVYQDLGLVSIQTSKYSLHSNRLASGPAPQGLSKNRLALAAHCFDDSTAMK